MVDRRPEGCSLGSLVSCQCLEGKERCPEDPKSQASAPNDVVPYTSAFAPKIPKCIAGSYKSYICSVAWEGDR